MRLMKRRQQVSLSTDKDVLDGLWEKSKLQEECVTIDLIFDKGGKNKTVYTYL